MRSHLLSRYLNSHTPPHEHNIHIHVTNMTASDIWHPADDSGNKKITHTPTSLGQTENSTHTHKQSFRHETG